MALPSSSQHEIDPAAVKFAGQDAFTRLQPHRMLRAGDGVEVDDPLD